MGNDGSPGSQHYLLSHHNLRVQMLVTELTTVIRNKFIHKILYQFWLSASIKNLYANCRRGNPGETIFNCSRADNSIVSDRI